MKPARLHPILFATTLTFFLLTGCRENEEPATPETPASEEPTAGTPDSPIPKEQPEEAGDPADPKDADFVGLSEAEAGALAEERGLAYRTVEKDGEKFMVTADYRTDRVNFTVENGKVVKVERG